MTTIAYRAGEIAADSGVFDRGCHVGSVKKIFRAPDGRIGGLAGCLGDRSIFMDWLEGQRDGSPVFKDDETEAILVDCDGGIEWFGSGGRQFQIEANFIALGAGFEVAMGALHMGASAAEAVEVAARVNVLTRGPVVSLGFGK